MIRRKVSYEEGKKYAQDHGLLFFETSAKDSYGIDQVINSLLFQLTYKIFIKMTDTIFSKIKDGTIDVTKEVILLFYKLMNFSRTLE